MKTVQFRDGRIVPALGLGTWNLGDNPDARKEEIAALQCGIELGMTLIDTAEMYGEGKSEELVGEAIRGCRDQVFLVSKVYPQNATRKGLVAACERSLRRLGVEVLDLYLLHWRGSTQLSETVEGFERLAADGKIRGWGVSNFDTPDMQECWNLKGGKSVSTDQILYNLTRRSVEYDLLPWCREKHIAAMAYSPVEQGRLTRHKALDSIASARGVSRTQIALSWLLMQDEIIAIPKSGKVSHVEENRKAADIALTAEELAELDRAFPRPRQRKPLEML